MHNAVPRAVPDVLGRHLETVHSVSAECRLCRQHCAESYMEPIADLCHPSLPTAEEARCAVCEGPGELCDLFFCTSCGHHYHGACLDTALTARKRAGWQCPECKVCQACRYKWEGRREP